MSGGAIFGILLVVVLVFVLIAKSGFAPCAYCNKEPADEDGICTKCKKEITIKTEGILSLINEGFDYIENPSGFKAAMNYYEGIKRNINELMPIEADLQEKGINYIDPPMYELLLKLEKRKDELVEQEANSLMYAAINKAESLKTATAKINAMSKAVVKLKELKEIKDNSLIQSNINHLNELSLKLELSNLLEAAHKFEFKGNKTKAVDRYLDVLYFLRSKWANNTSEIETVEAKIRELGGKVPGDSEPAGIEQ